MSCKTCDICGEEFGIMELKVHKRREHVLIVEVTIEEYKFDIQLVDDSFLCPVSNCGKKYQNIDTFRKHLKEHDGTVKIVRYEDRTSPAKLNRYREEFDFQSGCKRALLDNEVNQGGSRAYHEALSLSCEPIVFHLGLGEDRELLSVPALVHTKVVKSMANEIEFSDSSQSIPVICEVQLHQQKQVVQPSPKKQATLHNSSIVIDRIIRLSPLPGLLNHLEYQQPSTTLLDNLNKDFRLYPKILLAVAELHSGALIMDGDQVLIPLTVEAYSRSKSVDCHSESSMQSLPPAGEKIFIGICEESDGRGIKKKFKIGFKHANLLITMSVSLGINNLKMNIGPETVISGFNTKDLAIYYSTESIASFEAALQQGRDYCPAFDMNKVRQLISGFNNPATFQPYRATAECFLPCYETHLPATVFTLCDLPTTESYGVSNTSAPKIGSRFLSIIAASEWEDDFKISHQSFKTALQLFHAHSANKGTMQWNTVREFVTKLKTQLDANNGTINMLECKDLNTASLANVVGQSLSAANKQIVKNVEIHLREKFGNFSTHTT